MPIHILAALIWLALFFSGCSAAARAHLQSDINTVKKDAVLVEHKLLADLKSMCNDLPTIEAAVRRVESYLPVNADVAIAETALSVLGKYAEKVCPVIEKL